MDPGRLIQVRRKEVGLQAFLTALVTKTHHDSQAAAVLSGLWWGDRHLGPTARIAFLNGNLNQFLFAILQISFLEDANANILTPSAFLQLTRVPHFHTPLYYHFSWLHHSLHGKQLRWRPFPVIMGAELQSRPAWALGSFYDNFTQVMLWFLSTFSLVALYWFLSLERQVSNAAIKEAYPSSQY